MPKKNNPQQAHSPTSLQAARKLTYLLDNRFRLPGTDYRFGVDPLLGLIPGVGDGISLFLQLAVVFSILQNGASGKLLALLLLNILVDTVFGSIPILGQIWDFYFKASERNVRLAEEYFTQNRHQGSGWYIWLGLILMAVAVLAALVYLIYALVNWLAAVLS